ncbi:hypothetical protein [Phytohabitans aurantiacus]|jgi:hypothetical protein|uniref:Uncharacterized protein n=1 Tax=Phytohabitans aurantiacus TaxID=3016789 RepID=A0ABQ5RCL2_9ACTN|nr:hypothetical protein [Phytohabitans aurantiacus]GLI03907.1 hypothetical protein Pa4123_91870 [Phytohabitans aurantiacus]
MSPSPDERVELPDAAITTGAQAVAAFANKHQLQIPPALREDLARDVLTAAHTHLFTGRDPKQ